MNKLKLFAFMSITASVIALTPNAMSQLNKKSEQNLDAKQQSLVAISALAGKGDLAPLHTAINKGLDAGWTVNELKEAAVHIYAYAGFPRSLNTLNTLRTVINERKQKGITDEQGREPNPLPVTASKLESGTALQTKLLGTAMKTSTADFAPIIDVFLKEHLFWDIFGRDNLDFKTRELITISTLAGLGNAEAQLRSHINVSIYNGITEPQLNDWVAVIHSKVGSKEGTVANEVLQQALNRKPTTTATTVHQQTGIIFPTGEKITNNNFRGTAYLQQLVLVDSNNITQVGNVTFEPGARSNWHLHPGGQILLVTSGTGYYQEKGSSKKIIRKGDVVICPPNVPHWHGASKDDVFIQIAITNTQKGLTVWLQPVTEEEYHSGVKQ